MAQLEAAPLLRRLDLASDRLLRARGTLTPRADAASAAGSTRCTCVHLPDAVVRRVLTFVPADARARAALVCRAWRDTVADARLWTVLDLSPASGVAQPVSDATLRGAAALARGQLTVLCLDDCEQVTRAARLEVVTANGGSLRELSCCFSHDPSEYGSDAGFRSLHVEALAAAAPQLAAFTVDVAEETDEYHDYDVYVAPMARVMPLLWNYEPFGALQLRRLSVRVDNERRPADVLNDDELHEFCEAVSAHVSLNQLVLSQT